MQSDRSLEAAADWHADGRWPNLRGPKKGAYPDRVASPSCGRMNRRDIADNEGLGILPSAANLRFSKEFPGVPSHSLAATVSVLQPVARIDDGQPEIKVLL